MLTKRKASICHFQRVLYQLFSTEDDDVKRSKWPLGRITKTMPGNDGIVRVVEVTNKSGTYTRPVTKVYALEDDLCNESC